MTDDELRALVRDAVSRHLNKSSGGFAPANPPTASLTRTPHVPSLPHPSHVMYLTLVNEGDACVIEPAVTCNHCGYCKSHGH